MFVSIFNPFYFSIPSYDIEKQEVIELPSQSNVVSFNAVDENHHSTPPPLINKDDTPQKDAPETSTPELDVRFDVCNDKNLDQNDK